MKVLTILTLLALPGVSMSADAVSVHGALFAKDVIARQPVEPGSEFPPDVGALIFWTKVKATAYPTTVTHVWYFGGKEIYRAVLKVNSPSWRTWSRKGILPSQIGEWKAVVLDEAGSILKEAVLKIVKSLPSPQVTP